MQNLIPIIVTGGIVKKFSDSMLGKPKKKGRGIAGRKAVYPSRNRPF